MSYCCRSCGKKNLIPVLSMGRMPLANALLTAAQLNQPEQTYPLDLVFCPDCALVQITETVAPEVLFGEYLYFSSYSDTMLAHARTLVEKLVPQQRLSQKNRVVEIASNDGYLLQYFKQYGIPVLGIEPAANIARVAEEKGIPTLCQFFTAEVARSLRDEGKGADVILGLNVLAHVANLNDFVEGVRILLKPAGAAVFEFSYVKDMVDEAAFDMVYHEHLCYYSLTSVRNLFHEHHLDITDVERLPVHGGSLRIYARHEGSATVSPAVASLLKEERGWGVSSGNFYQSFATKVESLKIELKSRINQLKGEGKRIAGYGAAAKAAVLLNYFGIGKEQIDYIADRSPFKQGRYLPGNHIPIRAPDEIKKSKPDYILILAWNLKDEVMEQLHYVRERGGKFIIPIPEVRIV